MNQGNNTNLSEIKLLNLLTENDEKKRKWFCQYVYEALKAIPKTAEKNCWSLTAEPKENMIRLNIGPSPIFWVQMCDVTQMDGNIEVYTAFEPCMLIAVPEEVYQENTINFINMGFHQNTDFDTDTYMTPIYNTVLLEASMSGLKNLKIKDIPGLTDMIDKNANYRKTKARDSKMHNPNMLAVISAEIGLKKGINNPIYDEEILEKEKIKIKNITTRDISRYFGTDDKIYTGDHSEYITVTNADNNSIEVKNSTTGETKKFGIKKLNILLNYFHTIKKNISDDIESVLTENGLKTDAEDTFLYGLAREYMIRSTAIPTLSPEEENNFNYQGQIQVKDHFQRERDKKLITAKKKEYMDKNGHYNCEICDFDFEEKYGPLGHDFMECHDLNPMFTTIRQSKPKTKDLVMVCSNCHRMIHRMDYWPRDIKELRDMLLSKTAETATDTEITTDQDYINMDAQVGVPLM